MTAANKQEIIDLEQRLRSEYYAGVGERDANIENAMKLVEEKEVKIAKLISSAEI